MANILAVDDEHMVRDALSSYFSAKGHRVFTAGDGREALSVFGRESIDIVILDLMLPGLSGEEVCSEIRRRSDVPIIMLTAKAENEDAVCGLRLGADDYVTKPFSIRELHARVDAVLRRTLRDGGAETVRFGGLSADFAAGELRVNGEAVPLTAVEWRILRPMLKHPRRIFTRGELLDAAFSEESAGSDRVIDTHIKNIRKKLGDDPHDPHWIRTVYGLGYRFEGER